MLPSIWQLWDHHWSPVTRFGLPSMGETLTKWSNTSEGPWRWWAACDIQGKVEKTFNPNERRWMWYREDYCCWWLSDAEHRADRSELFLGKHSGRTRGWDQKLEHGNSIPIPMTVVSDRKGCLDRLWNLYPSKLNWPQPPLWFIWTYNE